MLFFFTLLSGEGRLPYAFPHTGPYSFSVRILQNICQFSLFADPALGTQAILVTFLTFY
jgi:hypothetical protein